MLVVVGEETALYACQNVILKLLLETRRNNCELELPIEPVVRALFYGQLYKWAFIL